MMRLILVPLDGSDFGEHAIPVAQRLAERESAELELVHVAEVLAPYQTQGAPPLDPRLDRDLESDRSAYLTSLADWLRQRANVTVKATLLEGPAGSTFAEYVRERGADLVVMTTHGRGGLSRAWLGSVASDVVRLSSAPVLLIRPSESGSRSQAAPAFERVLVPLDTSSEEQEALEHALAVAGPAGPQFMLLHVISPVVFLTDLGAAAYPDEEQLEALAEQYLNEVAERVRARGFSVQTRVLRHPHPARAILEQAEGEQADLIAMETHGHRLVGRLLMGSVADKVVRGAHVPVLVHRPQASPVNEEA
jgi:nucleotide-binding universal stress UspA family protein